MPAIDGCVRLDPRDGGPSHRGMGVAWAMCGSDGLAVARRRSRRRARLPRALAELSQNTQVAHFAN